VKHELGPTKIGRREYYYRIRHDKQERGECINCSLPAVVGQRRCDRCRRKHNAEVQRKK
jgi:hypothetical protein